MPHEPVIPSNVYPGNMAPHMPIEQYRAAHGCTCGHAHGHGQVPAQQIIIKQSDPWVKYLAMGFAGAGIGLMVFASVVAMLIAAGVCALCVAVASWALRGLLNGGRGAKK
ncbi:hypothetical protein [Streptomyces griseomycini]|uniref:SpdD protein n=1 Tax=Streptomyces griseomycini TaxID=66895 RepID=A0A7W7PWF5_9ACTN|nr:hypothetical protein [Streptomyces griseomycini]MBB4902557.1 hypothetical protein [Streptomyces griseomycini]GGR54150.1 hypothetical protein GCM10015536_69280 [Streptomyces griseomycini]